MNKFFSKHNLKQSTSLISTPIKLFSTKSFNSKKSIYNKSLNVTKENTIDITDSNEEMNRNIKLELKNLEKSSSPPRNQEQNSFEIKQDSEETFTSPIMEPNLNKPNTNLNFDYFKQRNKEIHKQIITQKGGKTNSTSDPSNESQEKEYIDEKTLAKLQDFIKNDKDNKNTQYKSINPDNGESEYESLNSQASDNAKELLVNRPVKNFVWGLGNQTKQKKFKFVAGEYPTAEAIVTFLEVNNLQDIIVVPTHELGLIHLKPNAIICSGYTPKHIYKAAKDLVVEIKKLKIPNLPYVPSVSGRRDEPWNIVEIGDITTHFFVEAFREEVDLLGRWTTTPDEEFLEWQRRVDAKYYGKKKL